MGGKDEGMVLLQVGSARAVDSALHGGVLPAGGQGEGAWTRLLPPLRQVHSTENTVKGLSHEN